MFYRHSQSSISQLHSICVENKENIPRKERLIMGINIMQLYNAGKTILPHLGGLRKFQTPYEAHESYIKCQSTLEESQAYEVRVKMESVRLFLESCINSEGKFQTKKLPVLRDFVKSMGFTLHRCFDGNDPMDTHWDVDNDAPAFYVTSTEISEREQDIAHALDKEIDGYAIMAYRYEEVRNSRGFQRIFRMEFMGDKVTHEMETKKKKSGK